METILEKANRRAAISVALDALEDLVNITSPHAALLAILDPWADSNDPRRRGLWQYIQEYNSRTVGKKVPAAKYG